LQGKPGRAAIEAAALFGRLCFSFFVTGNKNLACWLWLDWPMTRISTSNPTIGSAPPICHTEDDLAQVETMAAKADFRFHHSGAPFLEGHNEYGFVREGPRGRKKQAAQAGRRSSHNREDCRCSGANQYGAQFSIKKKGHPPTWRNLIVP